MSPCEPVSSVHLSLAMMLSMQYLADAKPLLYFPHPLNLPPYPCCWQGTEAETGRRKGRGRRVRERRGGLGVSGELDRRGMKQNHPLGRVKGGGGGGGEGGGGGGVCCCFLPDFSDDRPAISLGQDPCSWSLESGSLASTGAGCADCAAGSSAEMERWRQWRRGGGGKAGRGGA